MLQWCSYCQRFLGEKPPFKDHTLTHGVCPPCSQKVKKLNYDSKARIKDLKTFQRKLNEFGQINELSSAMDLIDAAASKGIREVDLLLGFLAPLLSRETGDSAEEKLFEEIKVFVSVLVENLRIRISSKINCLDPEVLLTTTNKNQHILGIQLLELWLCEEGIAARAVLPEVTDIFFEFKKHRPKVLGVSMASPRETGSVRSLIQQLASISGVAPLFLVGGSAVKLGLVSPDDIPEASLIADTQKLFLTIKTHLSLGFLYELKVRGG